MRRFGSELYIKEVPCGMHDGEWLACVPLDDYTQIFFNPDLCLVEQMIVEANIIEILIHEVLHQVIWSMEGCETSLAFDRLFHGNRTEKLAFCKEILGEK